MCIQHMVIIMHKIEISVRDDVYSYFVNKKPKNVYKLLMEAEKHFDFSFDSRSKNTKNKLENHSPNFGTFVIPKAVMDKFEASLPEFQDIANLGTIKLENGDQPISSYELASAILAQVKAYNNKFKFKANVSAVRLNEYMDSHDLGDFFED